MVRHTKSDKIGGSQNKSRKDIPSGDDWSHSSEIDSNKTRSISPISPHNSTADASNNLSNPAGKPNDKSEELKDQSNTEQYLRFVNEMIKERLGKLRQLKDDEKKFQNELSLLQNKIRSRYELERLQPRNLTNNEAMVIIHYLEEEYERMEDKLLYQELIVQRTKDELATKQKQIEQVKEKLKEITNKSSKNQTANSISELSDELKKTGMEESNKVFQIINELTTHLDYEAESES